MNEVFSGFQWAIFWQGAVASIPLDALVFAVVFAWAPGLIDAASVIYRTVRRWTHRRSAHHRWDKVVSSSPETSQGQFINLSDVSSLRQRPYASAVVPSGGHNDVDGHVAP